jgi:LmbE family N-acetylglucosaminyl deacetylase
MAYRITGAAFEHAGDPTFAPTPDLAPWQPQKLYELGMLKEMIHYWREAARKEQEKRAAETAANPSDSAATEESSTDPRRQAFFEEIERRSISLEEATTAIAVGAYRPTTMDALRCHRTQIPEDSNFYRDRSAIPAELRDYEHFRLVKSRVAVPAREDDVFAGLR